MTDLPPGTTLSDIPADVLNPAPLIAPLQADFIHTVQAGAEDLGFGDLQRRTPGQTPAETGTVLSFGNLIDGDIIAIPDAHNGDIALYFIERYGNTPEFYQPPSPWEMFEEFLPQTELQWPQDIRNLAYFTPERRAFLADQFGIEAAEDVCIAGREIPSRIETSNAVRDPLVETFVMDAVLSLQGFSPRSGIVYDTVTDPENNILICAFDDGGDGRYYPEQRIVNINYSNSPNFEMAFLDTPENVFWDTYRFVLITAYEEGAHAHIDLERPENNLNDGTPYRSDETILFWLAEEAFVKVNMAVDAVTNVYELEDNALFEEMLRQNNGETDMVRFLLAEVRSGRGYEALNDPDTLFEAFTLFFRNENSMAQYYPYLNTPEIGRAVERNQGQASIPVRKLELAFGTLLGDEDGENFLEGRIDSVSDLLPLLPEGSDMRAWIESSAPEQPGSCVDNGVGQELRPDC